MKKRYLIVLILILVFAVIVGAWFYGYYNRKSNDNLPTLATIAEMNEIDVNTLLVGYKQIQLIEVWEEPDGHLSGFWSDTWRLDNEKNEFIIVYYDKDGIVQEVKKDNFSE